MSCAKLKTKCAAGPRHDRHHMPAAQGFTIRPLAWLLSAVIYLAIADRSMAESPADYLVIARASAADGLYAKAEQNLVKYLAFSRMSASREDFTGALSLYCQVLSAQHRFGDVISILDQNADVISRVDQRPFLYWRALALVETGDAQGAIKLINPDLQITVRTNDVENLKLIRISADAYSRLGTSAGNAKSEQLLEFLFKVAKKNGETVPPGSRLLYARLLLRDERIGEAAEIFGEIGDSTDVDDRIRASALLGLMSISTNDASRLLECSGKISSLKLGNDSSSYLIPCGRSLVSNINTKLEGAVLLKKAILSNPTSPEAPDAQFMLAEAWLSAGSNSLAAAEFKNFLETYSAGTEKTAAAIAGEASALYNTGSFDESATLFLKSSQMTAMPVAAALYTMRAADSMYAAGKYETAVVNYLKAADCPQHETLEGAVERIFAVDDIDMLTPSYIMRRSTFMAADAYEKIGRVEESIAGYKSLLDDREPGALRDNALYRLAMLYERQEKNIGASRAAIESYGELIESTTNAELKCNAMLGRGRCHYRLRSLKSALQDFDEVERSTFPVADEAALYRIYTLYGMGDDEAARDAAVYFIKNRPDAGVVPSVMFWLAHYYYNRGVYSEAQKVFLDFARRYPIDERAALSLLLAARSAVNLTEYQSAVDTLTSLGQNYPESSVIPEARYTQAQALCRLARFEDAVLVINDLTARFPSDRFSTLSLVLKGDALYSLSGSAEADVGINSATNAYATAAARIDATDDVKMECAYKTAKCMEKSGDANSAFDMYYNNVILKFREMASNGDVSLATRTYFSHASFAAAALLEQGVLTDQGKDIKGAINLLEHVVRLNAPEKDHAASEITRLRNL